MRLSLPETYKCPRQPGAVCAAQQLHGDFDLGDFLVVITNIKLLCQLQLQCLLEAYGGGRRGDACIHLREQGGVDEPHGQAGYHLPLRIELPPELLWDERVIQSGLGREE